MENVRTYRDELKGLAILWVVFFHMELSLTGPVQALHQTGYGGVDVFFFLSGMGLYASLEKNPHGYLARRARRLLPSYWPFCALWLAVMIPLNHLNLGQAVQTVLGNALMLGYFFQAPLMINWYVSALAASILLAPVLYLLLKKRPQLWPLGLLLCFAAGLPFLHQNQMMAASRLPVFFLGMVCMLPGAGRVKRRTLLAGSVAGLAVGGSLLFVNFRYFPEGLVAYGGYWYPFFLIAPALCWLIGGLLHKAAPKGCAPLRHLGQASFEIFLVNVWLEWLMKKQWQVQDGALWLAAALGSILLGLAYHAAVSAIQRKKSI